MSTLAANYEHLPTNTRTNIRYYIVEMIRKDPRPNATYQQRLDSAVQVMARKYGVKTDTIYRVFADSANVCNAADGSAAFPGDVP